MFSFAIYSPRFEHCSVSLWLHSVSLCSVVETGHVLASWNNTTSLRARPAFSYVYKWNIAKSWQRDVGRWQWGEDGGERERVTHCPTNRKRHEETQKMCIYTSSCWSHTYWDVNYYLSLIYLSLFWPFPPFIYPSFLTHTQTKLV